MSKPWISSALWNSINRKHQLFKQYRAGSILFLEYNIFKNTLTNALRRFIIDQFIMGKKNASNISLIDEHGSEQNNPKNVSNMFCKYFLSVAEEANKDIPSSVKGPLNYLDDRNVNYFFALPGTPAEVRDIIMSFPNKKCKTDSIPTLVYNLVADHLSFIICDIFNRSIEIGHYPNCLKVLRVIPIFKALQRNVCRPISISHCVAKIIDTLMNRRMLQFCD